MTMSLYGSFKVPGVNHVQLYRDSDKANKFYMMSSLPTIATDDQGQKLFTFILYARNVDQLAPEDRQVERGYLALSTQVAVSDEDEQKIRDYLRQMLNDERNRGYRFLNLFLTDVEPELGYPEVFTEGSVSFETFGPDMVPYSAGSKQPSLIGTNIASFSQTLDQNGAELFRQAVEKGKLPAIINYQLKVVAQIPAVSIHIHGDRSEFYRQVKEYVTHTYVSSTDYSIFGYTWYRYRYSSSWQEFVGLQKFRDTFQSLKVDIDDKDFRESEASDDLTKKLEEMAFRILETSILPSFFEPAIKEAAAEVQQGQTTTTTPPPKPTSQETVTGTIDVWINRSDVVQMPVNPNAQLGQVLTKEEIAANTVYVDLSNTFFEELDVRVNANVNFTADPIYMLTVFLDYNQMDERRAERVTGSKTIAFKSSDNVGRFRQIMAKSADGSPKDSYNYWSQLIYKDTGASIRVPASGALQSRERELVISYQRLGFVKVTLLLATMPDSIRSVQVKMIYPGSNLPSAQQSFELTKEKPTANFFTYTGQTGEPQKYHYWITYNLTDGQRMDMPEQSDLAESLTIPNPFDQTVTTRFTAQADFGVVQKIYLDARYRDPLNDFAVDHHAELANNGETSAWSFGLRNSNKRDFEYTVTILYKNGSRQELAPVTNRKLGDTIFPGEGAVDALEVTIVPSTIDWTKYKLALLTLVYEDAAHGIKEDQNFTFRQATSSADVLWKVLLRNKDLKSYHYHVRYLGVNASDNHEVDGRSDDSFLIFE